MRNAAQFTLAFPAAYVVRYADRAGNEHRAKIETVSAERARKIARKMGRVITLKTL